MMLRNRDLNIHKNEDTSRLQQKGGVGKTEGAPAHKRQAPNLVQAEGEEKGLQNSNEPPRPKRAYNIDKEKRDITINQDNNNAMPMPISAFSRSLLIDSSKKENISLEANNNGKEKRVSVGQRKRTTGVLTIHQAIHAQPNNVSSSSSSNSQEDSVNMATERTEADREELNAALALDYDFDRENMNDMAAVSDYAQDIFNYYKQRERSFKVDDYLNENHKEITAEARAKIVDWMVELQETFELNHETLYLAVKLMDLFMCRTQEPVTPVKFKLIASAVVFIASKFDERAPPLMDDFIYLSEDVFTREELLEMERHVLKMVDFDLGAPLSYRFLRRFARVSKLDMGTLTLARYVLETSLMFLDFCRISESLIASAALLMAIRMKGVGNWNPVLVKYTGFTRSEVEPVMWRLNRMMAERKSRFHEEDTVFRKYSHEIFFEVAKVKLLCER